MLTPRPFWVDRIEGLWRSRSIVWLAGARRLGKTVLGRQVPEAQVFNCDLPSVRERLADPELFYGSLAADCRIVLDEVHRADDPSGLLKIGADEHPGVRILATGSSTLHASARFRDSLVGRKWPLRLAPVLWRECPDWLGAADLDRRLLHGGFPEQLLAAAPDPQWFEEWAESFFARDVHALFGTRNRTGFLRAASQAFARNGELLDVTSLARDAGVSRPTAVSYLDLLDACQVTVRLPPFHGGGRREMVRRPRLYALDTGLVCHFRGWTGLRPTDRGPLWENLVLDELLTAVPRQRPPLLARRGRARGGLRGGGATRPGGGGRGEGVAPGLRRPVAAGVPGRLSARTQPALLPARGRALPQALRRAHGDRLRPAPRRVADRRVTRDLCTRTSPPRQGGRPVGRCNRRRRIRHA